MQVVASLEKSRADGFRGQPEGPLAKKISINILPVESFLAYGFEVAKELV